MSSNVRFKSRRKEVQKAVSEQAKRGLQAAAIEIAGEAKKRTPVDTGRLRASIAWVVSGDRVHNESYEGGAVTYSVSAPEGTALVGTNVEYAAAIHEGVKTQEVKVKAHARTITEAFGKPIKATQVRVSGHTRQLYARQHRTGHKFLESAAREQQDRSRELIAKALRGEL